MSNNVTDFPMDKANVSNEILWKYDACKHTITEVMEKENAPKSKVLPLNLGGIAHF